MKEHPILFSPVMVEAIQEGRKTMTRREIKLVSKRSGEIEEIIPNENWPKSNWKQFLGRRAYPTTPVAYEILEMFNCPYGQIGDHLWVKETHFLFGAWKRNGVTSTGKEKWKFHPHVMQQPKYLDNPPLNFKTSRDKENPGLPKWYKRNSLFMPKWASRITLEVTAIRAEKVKEISEQDAMAEGVEFKLPKITSAATGWKHCQSGFYNAKNASHSFFTLWEKINGEQSLESNPYVWVITFKNIKQ